MLSAKNIFLTNPIINSKIPNLILMLLKIILFFKIGINSLALKIGPAIS